MRQQGFADAGRVHMRSGSGSVKCANGLVGLDLRDKDDIAIIRNGHIGGFASLLHQVAKHRPSGIDHLDAPGKRTADSEGLYANRPLLCVLAKFQIAEVLQGHEQAMRGRGGHACALRQFGQAETVCVGDDPQQEQSPLKSANICDRFVGRSTPRSAARPG